RFEIERLICERTQLKKQCKRADDEQREGISVLRAEVRSTSTHLNKAEAIKARNTRGAVEKQGTYHETQFAKTQRGTRKQGLYIHTGNREQVTVEKNHST